MHFSSSKWPNTTTCVTAYISGFTLKPELSTKKGDVTLPAPRAIKGQAIEISHMATTDSQINDYLMIICD